MSSKGPKTTETTKTEQTRTGLEAAQPGLGVASQLITDLLPSIGRISPAQTAALGQLSQAAGATSELAQPAIGLASQLIRGGNFNEGVDMVRNNLGITTANITPLVTGSTDPSDDPVLQAAIQKAQEDAIQKVQAQFAGSGRTLAGSGIGARLIGEGVTEASLPFVLNERARRESQQLQAAQLLSNVGLAGGQFLDENAARDLSSRLQGVTTAAPGAQAIAETPGRRALEVEAIRQGIPLQNLGLAVPLLAGLSGTGGTVTGSGTKTSQTEDPNAMLKLGLSAALTGASLFVPGAGGISAAGNLAGAFGGGGLR